MEKELRKIIQEITLKDTSKLKLDDVIRSKTDIDSLDMVESIIALEDHYEIQLDEGQMDKVKSLGDIIAYIKAAQKAKKAEQVTGKQVPQDNNQHTKGS